MDPANQSDSLPGMFRPERVAMMRAFHSNLVTALVKARRFPMAPVLTNQTTNQRARMLPGKGADFKENLGLIRERNAEAQRTQRNAEFVRPLNPGRTTLEKRRSLCDSPRPPRLRVSHPPGLADIGHHHFRQRPNAQSASNPTAPPSASYTTSMNVAWRVGTYL